MAGVRVVVSTSVLLGLRLSEAARLLAGSVSSGVDLHYDNVLVSAGASRERVLEEYLDAVRAAGSRVYSIHAPYPLREAREALEIVDLASTLEYRGVAVSLHPWRSGPRTLLEDLEGVARRAEASGVVLGLENLAEPPWSDLGLLASVVERAGERYENVKICLDTGHARLAGYGLGAVLERYGGLIGLLHVHDNNGDWDSHLVPGRGSIDFSPLVDWLRGGRDVFLIGEAQCSVAAKSVDECLEEARVEEEWLKRLAGLV